VRKRILFQSRRPRNGRPSRLTSTIQVILILGLLVAIGIIAYYRSGEVGTHTAPSVTLWRSTPSSPTGTASVIDGDTISIGRTHVRLFGIDAPEHDQTCSIGGKVWECGKASARALEQKVANRSIDCRTRDHDQYGRDIATCYVDGEDIAAWLVSEGLAVAYRYYSTDYVRQEQGASASKRGMWQGEFINPREWRRGNRSTIRFSQPSAQPVQSRGPASVFYQRFGESTGTRYESLSECAKARERDGNAGICFIK